MKDSKEFENLLEAIHKWVKKHDGKVQFIGSFLAFKGKDFDVVDDRLLAFGIKKSLREDLKNLDEEVEKEKDEFVSW